MRNDLVGEYIGQTAPRRSGCWTRPWAACCSSTRPTTCYNDDDSRDFGQEAIGILLQVMENDRDKLVVILAGYKDRMDEFFGSNPGMRSRIAHHLDFAKYELGELLSIGRVMMGDGQLLPVARGRARR